MIDKIIHILNDVKFNFVLGLASAILSSGVLSIIKKFLQKTKNEIDVKIIKGDKNITMKDIDPEKLRDIVIEANKSLNRVRTAN